jgi:drug/metabolite transporter (DMT)-like permease
VLKFKKKYQNIKSSYQKNNFSANNIFGALLILLSSLCSASTNSLTHSLGSSIPPLQILFIKSFSALIVLCCFLNKKIINIAKTKLFAVQIIKGIAGFMGNWAWIKALQIMPVAQSSAISFSSAFFTSIGGFLFFKEKFIWQIWICIIAGFLGVMIITNPNSTVLGISCLLPLLSALFFSVSSLLVKTLSKQDCELTTLFYLLLNMSLISLIISFNSWHTLDFDKILRIILVGVFYLMTQLCIIKAYTIAMTSFIAPFKFARFPANILAGIIFFQEIPSFWVSIGGLLIFLPYIYMVRLLKKI